jgi:hypothetical protein
MVEETSGNIAVMKRRDGVKVRIEVSSAKSKGRWLQNWVANQISLLLNIPWGRDDGSLIEPRQMGQSGVDVILRGEAAEGFPYSSECKSGEKINWKKAVKQARANEEKGRPWLVFLKTGMFKKPIVMLDAELFFSLLSKFTKRSKNQWKSGYAVGCDEENNVIGFSYGPVDNLKELMNEEPPKILQRRYRCFIYRLVPGKEAARILEWRDGQWKMIQQKKD